MYSRELRSCVIVYFDLVEGKFKEVPPPSSLEKDDEMNLVVLGEHNCVYCDIDVEQIGVYAMEEYGKKDSWARLFVRPTLPISTCVKPLCVTKKGQVSIGESEIGIYDPKDGTQLSFGGVHALPIIA
ncbi:hypothetical protein RHGRI_026009 [Rhododendron griersonianum]|uniref:F-box protein n=1 Tax=Rhododendron griersonianum TaxID=479676 RepID=A0AAV6IRB3_9ERIC|nr:hypothetical protein RHGRI_026009 [Rhododendron griersonianum]